MTLQFLNYIEIYRRKHKKYMLKIKILSFQNIFLKHKAEIMDDKKLQKLFYKKQEALDIKKCIQCGTCSGSCPLTDEMDHAPRELFALIREGEVVEALKSNTPWYCVSCYQCTTRCPQKIQVTDLIYYLKELSVKQNLAPSEKVRDMYKAFSNSVDFFGKTTETVIMAQYGLKHPLDAINKMGLAASFIKKGRLEIIPNRTKHPKKLRKLMNNKRENE